MSKLASNRILITPELSKFMAANVASSKIQWKLKKYRNSTLHYPITHLSGIICSLWLLIHPVPFKYAHTLDLNYIKTAVVLIILKNYGIYKLENNTLIKVALLSSDERG